MSIHLPAAIDLYLRAENSGDVEVLADCFAPEATVRDEGRLHKGLAAIQRWKAETRKKYRHTVEPMEISVHGTKTTVLVRLTGTFPGSPITLHFDFVLDDGKITSLEMHP